MDYSIQYLHNRLIDLLKLTEDDQALLRNIERIKTIIDALYKAVEVRITNPTNSKSCGTTFEELCGVMQTLIEVLKWVHIQFMCRAELDRLTLNERLRDVRRR